MNCDCIIELKLSIWLACRPRLVNNGDNYLLKEITAKDSQQFLVSQKRATADKQDQKKKRQNKWAKVGKWKKGTYLYLVSIAINWNLVKDIKGVLCCSSLVFLCGLEKFPWRFVSFGLLFFGVWSKHRKCYFFKATKSPVIENLDKNIQLILPLQHLLINFSTKSIFD